MMESDLTITNKVFSTMEKPCDETFFNQNDKAGEKLVELVRFGF